MNRLWDQKLADRAAAIDQALKLGGRIIEPGRSAAGFQVPPVEPPRPPEPNESSEM